MRADTSGPLSVSPTSKTAGIPETSSGAFFKIAGIPLKQTLEGDWAKGEMNGNLTALSTPHTKCHSDAKSEFSTTSPWASSF
jgi:hypothetical protein